ncbi:MAG: trigger factor [Ruminococcus sp.]|nr:trigger factor [Ruminococcus sp.]
MSLINSTKLDEANKYELEVKVEKETFAAATIKAYKKQVKNINIPGFRKGKAPKHIIERMYGKGVFYDDAIEDTYPSALADATVEAKLKPVSVDDLSVGEVSEDGYTFKAKVTVAPELTVDGYKGIEVEKLSTEVTDELVDEELQAVRERNGRMVTVEDRAAENGDTTVIDFEGFVDGEAFEGGKSENYNLRLGDGNFIPGFEEAIVGHKTGEEFTIDVTFPEDYNAENLAGKEAQFKIKLHEIKTKELPEVDDEFVKDVSEKDTLDEYKEELKEKVAKRLEEQAEKDFDDKLTEALEKLAVEEIPEAMYDNEVRDMLNEFDMRLRSQGMDLATYMKYTGMDQGAIEATYKPQAEKRVKIRLVLEAIGRQEKIEVTDEDVEKEYEKLADAYKAKVDEVKTYISKEALSEDIKVEKAMQLVRDNAKVK